MYVDSKELYDENILTVYNQRKYRKFPWIFTFKLHNPL